MPVQESSGVNADDDLALSSLAPGAWALFLSSGGLTSVTCRKANLFEYLVTRGDEINIHACIAASRLKQSINVKALWCSACAYGLCFPMPKSLHADEMQHQEVPRS
jgi:hypothetical protein